MIKAAHVDKAHHKNFAKKALEEVIELDLAVETTLKMVNLDETLIIVTADHSHSLTINGYPRQGTKKNCMEFKLDSIQLT